MKPIEEPVRWLDPRSDATDDVRALLAGARDALGPTEEERTRLGAFVAGAGAGAGAGASAGASAGAGAGAQVVTKAVALKLGAILAVAGLGGGVGYTVLRATSEPRPVVTSMVGTSSGVAPGATAPAATIASEPAQSVSPAETAAAPTASGGPVPLLHTRASPSVTTTPAAMTTATPASAATAPATGVGVDNPPAAAAPAAAPAGESELALLDRARSRVGADPAGAMRALDEHRARFPSGTFVQEREVLAIEALVRLGRRPEAKARADAFARAFPTSAHRRRIAVLLGESPGD